MSVLNQMTNKKSQKNDHYQTPWYALDAVFDFIPKDTVIWDCACGHGNILRYFDCGRHEAFGTDIYSYDHCDALDFLTEWWTGKHFDIIITNPPFSLKTKFIERAAKYEKPFAFLMNITSLETARRQAVFQKCGLQLILPNKRISYIIDGEQSKSAWFYSAWFMFGFNLENDINYVEIKK